MEADENIVDDDVTGNVGEPETNETNQDTPDAIIELDPEPEEELSKSTIYVHQPKDDPYYYTKHPRRGVAVIFNHRIFDPKLHQQRDGTRRGTEVDCASLKSTLSSMGFEVDVQNDLTSQQISNKLDELAATNFRDCDCLLIAVLSHGMRNRVFAYDTSYPTNDLFRRFTADMCPTLAGKPKIFILQTCQGKRSDPGVEVQPREVADANLSTFTMPVNADFLIANSTIPGFVSFRNEYRGSWYIQSLCRELNEHWRRYDILKLLTFVNQRVAFDYISHSKEEEKNGKKQTSSFTSQLTRILKFSFDDDETDEDASDSE